MLCFILWNRLYGFLVTMINFMLHLNGLSNYPDNRLNKKQLVKAAALNLNSNLSALAFISHFMNCKINNCAGFWF